MIDKTFESLERAVAEIGRYGGALKDVGADDLGAIPLRDERV